MSNRSIGFVIALAVLVAACAAIDQQKSQPARPDNAQFHNLKVLPPNITREELLATMRGFTRALGVKCDHCHVRPTPEAKELDFPLDAKPEKNVARTMIRMTRRINSDYISKVDEGDKKVGCWTCHRGKVTPEDPPPPPPPPPPEQH